MSKAIVLPINILVIVAVATVAMLGLIGVYGVGYNPFSSAIGLESVKNLGCRQLVMGGCKVNTNSISVNYDANKNGGSDSGTNFNWATGVGDDNLAALCYNFFGRRDEKSCKQLCGCVGGVSAGGGGASCTCTAWVNGACGAGGCAANLRQQIRTCTPANCQAESRCIADVACGGGPCIPTTCVALGKNCGSWPDGCGGTLNCGTCNPGFNCVNGICTPVVCSCNWVDQNCNIDYCCWGGLRFVKRIYICNPPACDPLDGTPDCTWLPCGIGC